MTGCTAHDVDTVLDTLWALQPAAHLRLVADGGWSPERDEDWLADLLTRLFLEPDAGRD